MLTKILKEIEFSRFRPVYLFYGSDLTVSDDVIARLKQKLLVPGLEMFDYDTINATEIGRSEGLSIPILVQRIKQPPVGALRRLVVVRHLEQMNAKLLSEFCQALNTVPDSTTVVVVCSYDQSRSRDFRRVFKETGVDHWLIPVPVARDDYLLLQVQNWAREKGLKIDRQASTMLVEIAGEDPLMLKGEIEKFATALKPWADPGNCLVTVDVIRKYASSTRVFELRDYVRQCLERNVAAALSTLHRLELLGEEPKKIIGWLTHGLLDVLAVKLGVRSAGTLWRCPKTVLKWWEVEELDYALHRLFKIDVGILRGHREVFALLDIWTIICCRRRNPSMKFANK